MKCKWCLNYGLVCSRCGYIIKNMKFGLVSNLRFYSTTMVYNNISNYIGNYYE